MYFATTQRAGTVQYLGIPKPRLEFGKPPLFEVNRKMASALSRFSFQGVRNSVFCTYLKFVNSVTVFPTNNGR